MIKKINLIFLIVFISGCNESYRSKKDCMVIENAREFLIQKGYNVKQHIGYIEDNQNWQKVYVELKAKGNTEFLERFKELENRDFEVIVFKPREPNTLGGVYRVFICDGNVLTYYGEK